MKARYRVDVQRYTPSITPTPSPTAPPTATATAMATPTAVATPTDTCPRPPGQGVVALGLGQQTIRGRWDGNDCLHFPVTASTRLHIVLMLRSFGRDPEVSLLEGVGTGGAELAHNDDTLEGSGEESLLGRTVPAGGYTVRAEINRAPLSGSTYQLVIEAALKYAHAGHHQEDGNVEYTGPTVAAGADPLPAWADTLVEDMADQWEAASNGLVELCEAGTCSGSPEGLITPIEVVVGSRSNDPPSRAAPGCGRTIACVMYGEPPSSGHMGALTFRIESPAYSAGRLVTWTDVPALNNAVVGVDYYRYLPSVLLHELGHTLGLDDLRLYSASYTGMMMHKAEAHQVLTDRDRAYLLQVYRDHVAHGH